MSPKHRNALATAAFIIGTVQPVIGYAESGSSLMNRNPEGLAHAIGTLQANDLPHTPAFIRAYFGGIASTIIAEGV